MPRYPADDDGYLAIAGFVEVETWCLEPRRSPINPMVAVFGLFNGEAPKMLTMARWQIDGCDDSGGTGHGSQLTGLTIDTLPKS